MSDKNIEERRFEPGLKLARHKELGEYLDGKKVAPINIEISPSGKCNAACGWCFYRQDGGKTEGLDGIFFKKDRMRGLLEELSGFGVKSISWTGGGEPTIHPSFPEFVNWANWAGLKQGLFTNALNEIRYDTTVFDWIRVSKTNNPWNKNSIEKLRQCKTLGMCINYRGEKDDDTVRETLKFAEELHESRRFPDYNTYVQVRPALKIQGGRTKMVTPDIGHPLLKITQYKFMGSNSTRNYEKCEAFHFSPFIWQDGTVSVCGYKKGNPNFKLGSVYSKGKEGRFKDIMERAPPHVKPEDNCQVCCKLNAMNSMISSMRSLEDVDFP